jgi:hypothetical protein
VSYDPVRHPVQPDACGISLGYVREATPRREEHLGDRIVDNVGGDPSAAIVADQPVVAAVQLLEVGIVA